MNQFVTMSLLLLTTLSLLTIGLLWWNQLRLKVKNEQGTQTELLMKFVESFNQQMGTLTQRVNEQLAQTQTQLNQQLTGHNQVINRVHEKMGEITQAAKNMQELGRNVTELQDILKAPKLRGNLGEMLLEDLLRQMIPHNRYQMKYSYPSGAQVDAIIMLQEKFVPVDAKFPLESFVRLQKAQGEAEAREARKELVRSAKERIREIADKYIRPQDGSYDFAILYVPAENVYYEMITQESWGENGNPILSFAMERKIILASPNTFYAYLLAIAYGLNGLRIEKRAQEIQGKLSELQELFLQFSLDFNTLGNHLERASKKHQESSQKLLKLNDRFSLVTGQEPNLSPLAPSPAHTLPPPPN